jgi:DNA-directed RNA polymerase specialized sigma24 family protein
VTRVEQFEKLRPLLFAIARRIIAGMGEAEDAFQDSWLRDAPSTSNRPGAPTTSGPRRGRPAPAQ